MLGQNNASKNAFPGSPIGTTVRCTTVQLITVRMIKPHLPKSLPVNENSTSSGVERSRHRPSLVEELGLRSLVSQPGQSVRQCGLRSPSLVLSSSSSPSASLDLSCNLTLAMCSPAVFSFSLVNVTLH